MIIDFTVENYRSIKEPVTLSAVAQSRRSGSASRRRYVTPDTEIAPPYRVEGRGFELLPVLALFGANASGKSNVVMALDRLLGFMILGARDRGDLAKFFVPFKFDKAYSTAPSCFELRVAVERTIFRYSLKVSHHHIYWEHLDYTPSPPLKSRLLFDRRWDESNQRYVWDNGPHFVGPHVQLEETLQEYEPFTSLLVQRLKVAVTDVLANWLQPRQFGVGSGGDEFEQDLAIQLGHVAPKRQAKVADLVRLFDTGLADIKIQKAGENEYHTFALHETREGYVSLPFEEESRGTRRLYSLAHRILVALEFGSLLIVDELDASLHPHIVHEIVRLFQNPKTNPKRAQLIFTSHDNTLLEDELLRRDQVWFTEKRADGSTNLYALSDFRPRNDLALDKAYLDGRFGAVPMLPSEEELIPVEKLAR